MASANTVLSVLGATASISTTAAQSFLNSAGTSVLLNLPSSNSFTVPAGWNYNAIPFRIRMAGYVTNLNATSVTILPSLYIGAALATTSTNVAFCKPSAISSNLAAVLAMNFLLEAECMWDSVSAAINGNYSIQVGPSAGTGFVTNAAATSVTSITASGNAGTTGLNFVPYIAFSASSTNQKAILTEFSIDQI